MSSLIPPSSELPCGGIYLVEIRLAERQTITVGSLGHLHFDAGSYLYVGSAVRSLPQRISRHARRHKPLRWHVDYLTTRAPVARVVVWPPREGLEHQIATMLARSLPAFRGFGSSDCRCAGHLFRGDCAGALALIPDPPIADLPILWGD